MGSCVGFSWYSYPSKTKDLTCKDPNQVSWPFMDSDSGWCAEHPIVPVGSF
jgi:hypothetical protein